MRSPSARTRATHLLADGRESLAGGNRVRWRLCRSAPCLLHNARAERWMVIHDELNGSWAVQCPVSPDAPLEANCCGEALLRTGSNAGRTAIGLAIRDKDRIGDAEAVIHRRARERRRARSDGGSPTP
jgi:hypothetical protein